MNLDKWSPLRRTRVDAFRVMEEIHDHLLLPEVDETTQRQTKLGTTEGPSSAQPVIPVIKPSSGNRAQAD